MLLKQGYEALSSDIAEGRLARSEAIYANGADVAEEKLVGDLIRYCRGTARRQSNQLLQRRGYEGDLSRYCGGKATRQSKQILRRKG